MESAAQIVTAERARKLTLAGELQIRAADELLRAFRDARQTDMAEIDLAAVECCDAAALQLFCCAAATARHAGRTLHFVNVPDALLHSAAALGLLLFPCPNPGRGGERAI